MVPKVGVTVLVVTVLVLFVTIEETVFVVMTLLLLVTMVELVVGLEPPVAM